MEDFKQWDADMRAAVDNSIELAKKRSAAEFTFFSAIQQAKFSITDNGLLPSRDQFGDLRYMPRQGIMSACLTREDAAATLILQRDILIRLDRQRQISWWILGVLIVIAIKVLLL